MDIEVRKKSKIYDWLLYGKEVRKCSVEGCEETDSTPYIKPKQFFEESNQQIKPKITNMPPNFPENTSYPDFKEFFKKEEQKDKAKNSNISRSL